jgi:hypothetical protein
MDNAPVRREDVVCKPLDEAETMLYDPETEAVHILNSTARLIWELCDGEHTVADMAATIKGQCTGTEGRDVPGHVRQTLELVEIPLLPRHFDERLAPLPASPVETGLSPGRGTAPGLGRAPYRGHERAPHR